MMEIDLDDQDAAAEFGSRLRILANLAYRDDDGDALASAINHTPDDDVRGLLFAAIVLLTIMDERQEP